MVQYNKIIKNKKKGFTLVELMVVLAITAILAVLVGGGLIAYTRLARFEKNEANARTLFQTAQISLTRMETAGELDAFRRQVMEEGSTGDHFQNDVTVTDADGKTLVSRTKTELNQNVAALYYDRTGAAAGNHNALVERLLGDYIYDASLLNARSVSRSTCRAGRSTRSFTIPNPISYASIRTVLRIFMTAAMPTAAMTALSATTLPRIASTLCSWCRRS